MKMFIKLVAFSTISGICFVTVAAQINLALYGTASQDTTLSKNGQQYEANLAVIGPANNNWADGCSATKNSSNPWWGIQFTDLAFVTVVQFYYSKQNEQSLRNFRLYVKNGTVANSPISALCYTNLGKPNSPNLNQSIECYMLGRNVYIYNRFATANSIEICFIAIYDRNPTVGIHKVYCSNTTDSWADGTMLYNAEYINEDIDVFAVCKYIIYIPPVMNGNAKIDICEIEIGGCPYGKYGDSCQLLCPGNCMGPCDLKTGNCLSGCSIGWLDEKCDTACGEGKFGGQCLRDCSANCLSSPCDHVTGQCNSGCMKGWEGFNCTEECSNGHFGWNCSETCDGCITNECSHMNGVCKDDSVCKPGYMYGKYCNQSHYMIAFQTCSVACEAWHFGTNCTKMCYCLNKPCNIFTGECPDDGCQMGWKGVSCDQECTHGYFGPNCIQFCDRCFDHSCNKLNGSCDRCCKDGFIGPLCAIKADSASTDSKVSTQIGIFIGGLVLGALLTFGIMVIINRRRIFIKQRQKNKTANPKSHEQQYDNLGMETVSTYQDLTSHPIPNDYDQFNTLYVNQ